MKEQAYIIQIGDRYFYRYNKKSFLTAHSKWGARFFLVHNPGDQRALEELHELLKDKNKAHEIKLVTIITEEKYDNDSNQ